MARSAIPLYVTNQLVTAAHSNTYWRDNESAHWVGTTPGDVDYYTAATTKSRLAIGTAGQLQKVNAGATAPEWGGAVLKRQGGSATDWNTIGITDYTPDNGLIQCGAVNIVVNNANSGSVAVTFPQAYTNKPLVQVSYLDMSGDLGMGVYVITFGLAAQANTGFTTVINFSANSTTTFAVYWMAVGI